MNILSTVCIVLFANLLISCEQKKNEETDLLNPKERELIVDEKKIQQTIVLDTIQAFEIYYGNWFSIEYPATFTANPTEPVATFDNYSFVETDEANFLSPDGAIEFFVYSPQWGGEPDSYLTTFENEELIDEKETVTPSAVTQRWITFKDVSGLYTRSVVSIKSESTHLVFGIKYKNAQVYEMYKESYIRFKKSLRQYAD